MIRSMMCLIRDRSLLFSSELPAEKNRFAIGSNRFRQKSDESSEKT